MVKLERGRDDLRLSMHAADICYRRFLYIIIIESSNVSTTYLVCPVSRVHRQVHLSLIHNIFDMIVLYPRD